MELKKSPKADLERRRTLYILVGLVFILSTVFVAFEWTTTEVTLIEVANDAFDGLEDEIIPITMQQPAPPPPPPPAPQVEEILKVVEDDKEIEQVEIESTEDDVNTEVEINFNDGAPTEEETTTDEIFTVVENMPQFPGGDAALLGYISKSVKYPAIAQENGIQGRVIISFVIEKDGLVADATVVRGVDPALDKEALRVVNNMPKWKPGEQRGKPVRVKYTLPVTFRLQ